MVNKNDKMVLEFLEKMNSKKVVVDFNSTAENICSYLLSEIKKTSLPSNISSVKVRVYETQFDYAEESMSLSLRGKKFNPKDRFKSKSREWEKTQAFYL